ncbi:MAG: 5'/3'-nucleotidase SurE [Bacteroidota bacterium]|nr:5'/3'-nucleotidase SurE [Candidatus Kapabacteria bacterium]MDW8220461.1 5'/3'-nucleotidase SurE [Bacteroidota bacterium]
MHILVTNDDGIDSPGIYALVQALRAIGTVSVVAPDRQQSAVGHALTVSSPLRATKVRRDGAFFGYAINGTPADCVKIALCSLLEHKPDLLVSGINHGSNTSVNILYSGTVSAATEGMMMGLPSIAISLDSLDYSTDCSVAAAYAAKLAAQYFRLQIPPDTILNVNVPALPLECIKGFRVTRQGTSRWEDAYERRLDPMGREYFWLSGKYCSYDTDIDTDEGAMKAGYVAVTPIQYHLTNTALLQNLHIHD